MLLIETDPDFRRQPKTEIHCCICQRDLKGKFFKVYFSETASELEFSDHETKFKGYVGPECKNKVPKKYLF